MRPCTVGDLDTYHGCVWALLGLVAPGTGCCAHECDPVRVLSVPPTPQWGWQSVWCAEERVGRVYRVRCKSVILRLTYGRTASEAVQVEVELTLAVGLALMVPGQSTRRGAPFLGGAVHEALVF